MCPCHGSYILLVRKFRTSEMLDEWSTTSKLSNIKLSHIPDGRYIYIFYFYETRLSALPVFDVFKSFPVFSWLNFRYWITCQLCQFRCKSKTIYVLLHFFNALADWCFSWLYLNYHDWVSARFFPVYFSPWPKKKRHWRKGRQKMFPRTQSKVSAYNIALQGKMQF